MKPLEVKHAVQSMVSGKVVQQKVESLSPHRLCTLSLPVWVDPTNSQGFDEPCVLEQEDEDTSISTKNNTIHFPVAGISCCDPIIAFHTFIIVATDCRRLCVYTLPGCEEETNDREISPIVVTEPLVDNLDSNDSSFANSIVAMAATSPGISLIHRNNSKSRNPDYRFLGHVAVLTCQGYVHILQFLQAHKQCSNNEETELSHSSLVVSVQISFPTGYVGATCLCIHERFRFTSSTDETKTLVQRYPTLVVGHDSGVITCHDLFSEQNDDALPPSISDTELIDPSDPSGCINSSNLFMRVRWKGRFEFSIGSLSPMGTTNCQEDIVASTFRETDFFPSRFLAVGLVGFVKEEDSIVSQVKDTTTQPYQTFSSGERFTRSTRRPSMSNHSKHVVVGPMEIMDIEMAEYEWNVKSASCTTSVDDLKDNFEEEEEIQLKRCCIWPAVGMEIADTMLAWTEGRRKTSDIPSHATNAKREKIPVSQQHPELLCAAPKFCTINGDNNEWILGSLSSLNIFLGIHSLSSCNKTLSWGIYDERNQMRFLCKNSVPIGVHSLGKGKVACCMNDGTIFILPVRTTVNASSNLDSSSAVTDRISKNICVLTYSSLEFTDYDEFYNQNTNEEEDYHLLPRAYTHCFTAGVISVSSSSKNCPAKETEVFICGNACGSLDVFQIDPNMCSDVFNDSTNEEFINCLIQNGTVRLLLEELAFKNDFRTSATAWKLATEECFPTEPSEERIQEIIRDFKNPEPFMKFTKSLLFQIATGEFP